MLLTVASSHRLHRPQNRRNFFLYGPQTGHFIWPQTVFYFSRLGRKLETAKKRFNVKKWKTERFGKSRNEHLICQDFQKQLKNLSIQFS